MSTVVLATIGGLITLFCWGVGDWLTAKSSKKYSEFQANFAVQMPGALIMLAVMLLSGKNFPSVIQTMTILLIGIIFSVAYIFFIKALSTGSVGIVVPLSNIYPLITLFLSLLILGAVFSVMQIVAMVAIVLGATLLAYEKNHQKIPLKVLHRETFFALIAATLWGIGFFIVDRVINNVPWQMILGIESIFMGLFATGLLVYENGKNNKKMLHAFGNRSGLIAGVILSVGAVAFYLAASRTGSVIILAVIASGAPLVSSLLGAVIDREKIGVIKRVGATVVVAGIVLLNII